MSAVSPSAAGAYYCHTCQQRISAVFHPRADDAPPDDLDDQPTCPHCGDCFVERVEDDTPMSEGPTNAASGAPTNATPTPAPLAAAATPSVQVFQMPLHDVQQQNPGGVAGQQPFDMLLQNVFGMISPLLQQLQQPHQLAALQAAGLAASGSPPSDPSSPSNPSGEQLLPQVQSFQSSFPPLHQQLFMQPPAAPSQPGQAAQPPAVHIQMHQQQQMPFHSFNPFNPFMQLMQPMQQQQYSPSVGPNPFGSAQPFNPFGMFQQMLGLPFGGAAAAPAPGGNGQVAGSDFFFGGPDQLNHLIHQLMMTGSDRFGSPPASAAALAALPEFAFDAASLSVSANSDCSVCLEEFKVRRSSSLPHLLALFHLSTSLGIESNPGNRISSLAQPRPTAVCLHAIGG